MRYFFVARLRPDKGNSTTVKEKRDRRTFTRVGPEARRQFGFWPRRGNRSVPPWRLQGPPALPETPFTSTLLAIIIRVLWLRFLALFLSVQRSGSARACLEIFHRTFLALARRPTSSLILPTRRSLNNVNPRNFTWNRSVSRDRETLCFGDETWLFILVKVELTVKYDSTVPVDRFNTFKS